MPSRLEREREIALKAEKNNKKDNESQILTLAIMTYLHLVWASRQKCKDLRLAHWRAEGHGLVGGR